MPLTTTQSQAPVSAKCGCASSPVEGPIKGVQKLGESLYLSPGESITYTTQVLNSGYIKIIRLSDNGFTLETENNHCLKAGEAVHLFYGDGMCSTDSIGSCLYVDSVPSDITFTLKSGGSPSTVYSFKPTAIEDPDPATPGRPVTAWIAKAGDLTGYRTRLRLVLGDCRSARLLSVGAIKKDTNQLQLKGDITGIEAGDRITLGSYTGTVISANKAIFKNVCYTIIQMAEKAVLDVPFTASTLASLKPYQHVIEATAPALSCGWASVTIPGNLTRDLCRYKKHPTDQYLVGSWDFSMIWGKSGTGPDELPAHIAADYSNGYWVNVFDKGEVYV